MERMKNMIRKTKNQTGGEEKMNKELLMIMISATEKKI